MAIDLEPLFARFEAAWSGGEIPELNAFLPPADDPLRREALLELIRIDLEFRWRSATGPSSESSIQPMTLHDYRERFPELTTLALLESGLIVEEFRVRMRWGNSPAPVDFCRGFDIPPDRILPQLKAVEAELVDEMTMEPPSAGSTDTVHNPASHAAGDSTVPKSGTAGASPTTASRFGDYELLSEIARGGMGVVYKARQVSLNRIVGLKMIRSGELADASEVQRFLVEAEAAAQLDHPNIVPIYEVGEDNGQYFFSMGFVDGTGFDAQLSDGPLPPREAAALIKTIAEAVQFAHENAIVHRDLKPANILIDANGSPRITDFGLAKNIAADSGMTATGQVMGTPSYMPPEQASGKVDAIGPAADVYALGAILYAALTGRPPFQAANVLETLKQVVERDPVSPRQLNPSVDRDLETICLKCLEKDAAKRYPSARELAADLDRYCDDRPISARPLGRPVRIFRWCRRNKALAAVVILSAILTIASPIVAVVQYRLRERAEANRELAEKNRDLFRDQKDRADRKVIELAQALKRESSEKNRANRNLEQADEVVKQFVTSIAEEEGVLSLYPRTQLLRRKLLGMGREYYEKLISQNPNAKLSPRLAAAIFELAYIYKETGDRDKAETMLNDSLKMYKQLSKADPADREFRRDMGVVYAALGENSANRGKEAEALDIYRKALDIYKQLVSEEPNSEVYLEHLAVSHLNVGSIYGRLGRHARKFAEYQKGAELYKLLIRKNPTGTSFQQRLAECQYVFGLYHSQNGQPRDGLAAYQKALEIQKKLAADNPDSINDQRLLARTYTSFGNLNRAIGRPMVALSSYRKALAIREKLARENPAMTAYQSEQAEILKFIALHYSLTSQKRRSVEFYLRAMTIQERLANENLSAADFRAALADIRDDLGLVYQALGQTGEALATHKTALAIREKLVSDAPSVPRYRHALANSYNNLGNFYASNGEPAKSIPLHRQAVRIREQLFRSHPTVTIYQIELGGNCVNYANRLRENKPQEAVKLANRAVSVLEEVLKRDSDRQKARLFLRNAYWSRARAFASLDRHGDATNDWRKTFQLDSGRYRKFFQRKLSLSLAREKKHVEATRIADGLLKGKGLSSKAGIDLSRVYALAATAALEDKEFSVDFRRRLAKSHVDQALKVLKAIARLGVFRSREIQEFLRSDPDLKVLRDSPGFGAFAMSIGVQLPSPPAKAKSARKPKPKPNDIPQR